MVRTSTGERRRAAGGPRTAPPSRGTSQAGMGAYNARLVLSLIRSHGSLSKAAIARLTGLTAQAISAIIGQLERDGMLLRLQPVRGRVGQPSTPLSLDPEGAFSLGLKFGRRRCDLVVMDFLGTVRRALHRTYAYPTPGELRTFLRHQLPAVTRRLTPAQKARIAGLGVAVPFELWGWQEEVGAPPAAMDAWRDFDFAAEVGRLCPWPVHVCNDATAACAAELMFGNRAQHADFFYVFFASFIGGGVVLKGNLYPGRSGNAGAIGSMPVPAPGLARGAAAPRLIRCASLYLLEAMLRDAGKDPAILWRSPADWAEIGPTLTRWIEQVTDSLAIALVGVVAVVDFEAIVIDGAFPADVRRRVVERTRAKLAALDRRGLSPVAVVEGSIGGEARAIGAATLPLLAGFSRDREVLFKETA
jgi:predicted NBD/HSP70 family sugar kinase